MGCIRSKVTDEGDDLIADVEKIIADYAWSKFLTTSGRWRSLRLHRKHFTIEVPMNYFHFEETRPPQLDPLNQLQVTANKAPIADAQNKIIHPEQTHLEQKFVNRTNEEQTYEFRFEKNRTAAVTVNYQKGFSIGGNANFSLNLAQVVGLNLEARYECTHSQETGQTFNESLLTSVKSDITVPPRSARKAVVVLEERRIHAKFEVTVKMSMPADKAVVYIKNKDGERVSTRQINNLTPIFRTKPDITIVDNGKGAEFKVKGIVEGSVLSNHQICLQDSEDKDAMKYT